MALTLNSVRGECGYPYAVADANTALALGSPQVVNSSSPSPALPRCKKRPSSPQPNVQIAKNKIGVRRGLRPS